MNKLLLFGALFILLCAGSSFSASISGTVINSENNQPLPKATIYVENLRKFIDCGDDGNFVINYDVSLPLQVSVSHIGFASQMNIILSPGESNTIKLTPTMSKLDNVVVTANRYSREAYKVTQPITTAGQEEIQNSGNTLVSDVIRDFPGMDMNDAGPFRARPVIRGLFGTRILVLVDGERLNDQRDASEFAGVSMSLVDVNEIERIEVVNGPSSVLYGSDAMGGVINIITRQNGFSSELTPYAAYSGRYSTADEQSSNRFDLGMQSEVLSGSIGLMMRRASRDYSPADGWNDEAKYFVYRDGFYDTLNASQGTNFEPGRLANSEATVENYDANLGYKLSDKYRLDFDFGAYRASDIGYPGVPNDSTPYLFAYPYHNRDNYALTFTGQNYTGKMLRLTGKFYYEKISKDFFTDFLGSMVIPAGPGMTITLLNSLNHTEVSKYGFNFQELYAIGKNTNLTFGADYLHERIDGSSTSITHYDGFGPFPFNDTTVSSSVPKNNWNSLGTYLSGETKLSPFLLNAGLRFDNIWVKTIATDGYTDSDDNPLPTDNDRYSSVNASLGATYPLTEKVNIVFNAGTAYRAPNVVERFYYGSASGRETRPNPDIKPEKSVSFDLGVKAIHERINYSLMAFHSNYRDFTQLENFDSLEEHGSYTDLWRYENIDDVEIYGFEGVIEANMENGLYSRLVLSYQHGQNKTSDIPIFVTPLKTVITAGYRNSRHKFFGELTAKVVGDQNRIPDVAYLDDIPTEGYFILNATAGVKFNKYLRLSFSVRNLFDEAYSEPFNARNPDNPIPEPGRNFVISMSAGIGR